MAQRRRRALPQRHRRVDFNATFVFIASWGRGTSGLLPLTSTFKLMASHGLVHGPVDELVVGPVVDDSDTGSASECASAPEPETPASLHNLDDRDPVILPQEAITRFVEDMEGLQRVALALTSSSLIISTQPSSLVHRKPILMTHVHLGDAVPRCRRLPTKPWREAVYGLVGDFPYGPDLLPRTDIGLREACSRCVDCVGCFTYLCFS